MINEMGHEAGLDGIETFHDDALLTRVQDIIDLAASF